MPLSTKKVYSSTCYLLLTVIIICNAWMLIRKKRVASLDFFIDFFNFFFFSGEQNKLDWFSWQWTCWINRSQRKKIKRRSKYQQIIDHVGKSYICPSWTSRWNTLCLSYNYSTSGMRCKRSIYIPTENITAVNSDLLKFGPTF